MLDITIQDGKSYLNETSIEEVLEYVGRPRNMTAIQNRFMKGK